MLVIKCANIHQTLQSAFGLVPDPCDPRYDERTNQ
jgi:hypothetical protein